jgi:acyl-CoA thioesterase-1
VLAVEPGSFEEQAKQYLWFCKPDTNLPNVLILGDSISIGYTLGVRQRLEKRANVYRPVFYSGERKGTPENCGDTVKGLLNLSEWLSVVDHWDVIHFNWGLHDLRRNNGKVPAGSSDLPCNISLEKYEANLRDIMAQLQATGAKLIFALTTPYPEGVTPCRLPEDVSRYNEVALNVMNEFGVEIDDLFTLTKDRLPEIQQPKNVHFNPDGSALLAGAVSKVILNALYRF